MNLEQLRSAYRATPFQPFTIRMADGRSFPIFHPELLSFSPSGRTVVVQQPNDSISILDVMLMAELEFAPPSPAGGAAA